MTQPKIIFDDTSSDEDEINNITNNKNKIKNNEQHNNKPSKKTSRTKVTNSKVGRKRLKRNISKPIKKAKQQFVENTNDSDDDYDTEDEHKGLTQLEREEKMLEKYENEQKKEKENELRRKLQEKKDNEILKNNKDKRKEALKNIKKHKQSNKSVRSQLQEDYEEGEEIEAEEQDNTDNEEGDNHINNNNDSNKRGNLTDIEKITARIAEKREELYRRREEKMMARYNHIKNNMPQKKEEKPVDPRDLKTLTLSEFNEFFFRPRDFFETYYFQPYFEKLVKGFYVKIVDDYVNGENVYNIYKILHIGTQDEEYEFCGEKTKKCFVLVSHKNIPGRKPGEKRQVQMNFLSNKLPNCVEFDDFNLSLNKTSDALPFYGGAKAFYNEKIQIVKGHIYNDQEITIMAERKKDAGRVKINIAAEKIRLERDIEAAITDGKPERAKILQARYDRIVNEQKQNEVCISEEEQKKIDEKLERTRQENIRRDMETLKERKEYEAKITIGQRLQYHRNNPSLSDVMYMTQESIDKMVKENKLVKVGVDKYRTVVNSKYTIVVLKDLDMTEKEKAEKDKQEKVEQPKKELRMGEDEEYVLPIHREPCGNEFKICMGKTLVENWWEKPTYINEDGIECEIKRFNVRDDVTYYDREGNEVPRPKKFEDTNCLKIRLKNCDGTYTWLRPLDDVLKPKVIPPETKIRTGMTIEEYWNRMNAKKTEEKSTN